MATATLSRGSRNLNTTLNNKRKLYTEVRKRAEARSVKPKGIAIEASHGETASKYLATNKDGWSVEYLGKEAVRSKLVQVDISKVHPWLDNPRTYCACEEDGRTEEEEIQTLLANFEIDQLALQLANNGGIPEAIIGVPKKDGTIEGVDGNRRLVASKVLTGEIAMPKFWPKKVKQAIADVLAINPYPKQIPVKIYDGITRSQLKRLLAIKHGARPLNWPALQKGRFAYNFLCEESSMNLNCEEVADLRRAWKELTEKDQDVLRDVALQFGTRPERLRQYIMATIANMLYCELYETKDESGKQVQRERFNYFARFYGKKWFRDMAEGLQPVRKKEKGSKETVNFLSDDTEIETKFMEWLATNRITDCIQVDNLHRILDDERLAETFEEKGYKEAEQVLLMTQGSGLLAFAVEEISEMDAASLKEAEGSANLTVLRELKAAIGELEKALGEKL